MSYPRDLDEYTAAELHAELDRRAAARRADLCDYCGRSLDGAPCRFPNRHRRTGPKPAPDDAILRIKAVRAATGAGLSETKAACEDAGWDVAAAIRALGGGA